MKIPTSNVVPGQGAPSETEMLMALAEMHRQGRILGPETQEERLQAGQKKADRSFTDPSTMYDRPYDRVLTPGEGVPDRRQGGTARRDVRGI